MRCAYQGPFAAEGVAVTYCKPHGALYHAMVTHEGQARAVVDALAALRADVDALKASSAV